MQSPTPAPAPRARVTVTERAPAARFSLRGGPDAHAALGAALGLDLPQQIGTRSSNGSRSVLCLGPDEWVLAADAAETASLTAALADAATRAPLSAVEVSDRERTWQLEGPAVLDLLAAGCPLDLKKMPVGNGTRTIFDSAQIVLTREAEDVFHMTVWRSFVPHTLAVVDLATRELAAGL